MKRVVALILCAIMFIMAFASCADTGANTSTGSDTLEGAADNPDGPGQTGGGGATDGLPADVTSANATTAGATLAGATSTGATPADVATGGLTPTDSVYDIAFATFPPDTVMVRMEGYTVTWAELFVYMRSRVGTLSDYFEDEPIDWSAPWDDEISCAEWVLLDSRDEALFMKVLEYGSELQGVALSEDDWAFIREENSNMAIEAGGEEEFLRIIREEKGFNSLELYEYVKSFSRLSELLLMNMLGEGLEMMTDEEIEELIAEDGLIMAKHIFLLKPEYGGGDNALQSIEDILAELNDYRGEDFDAYFDELMYNYNDDADRIEAYPLGFLFRYGDLAHYYYEAASSLEINQLSGIVEGNDGYFIIYRLPINYDAIPVPYALAEDYRTLRVLAAYEKFDLMLNDWLSALNPVNTDELESIDISVMFKDA